MEKRLCEAGVCSVVINAATTTAWPCCQCEKVSHKSIPQSCSMKY
ncbi:hypothetical protein [Providencia sp. PROV212]|nr:hypothetical protein [Providencia sp. PROV212]